MSDRIIDIGIITVIPTEIDAITDVFKVKKTLHSTGNVRNIPYLKAELDSERSQRKLSIVISFVQGQGNTESAITTTNFLHDWYPRLMCLVGISAGISGKVKIGDVILPKTIHDYTLRKYENGTYFPRSRAFSRLDLLDDCLKLFPIRQENFAQLCKNQLGKEIAAAKIKAEKMKLTDSQFTTDLRICDGNLISDNVLIRDSNYFSQKLIGNDDRCQGGDMEASGFARACDIERKDFPWLVVRGISDFGDADKCDDFQSLAAKSACIALKEIIEHCINIDDFNPNPHAVEEKGNFQFDMIKQIREASEREDWTTVCNAAPLISRYLYLSSQYDLQIEIGELAKTAAEHTDNESLQAKYLVEDLGWTVFLNGDKATAKANIKHGRLLADEMGDYYLVAKAYRHQASIERRDGNIRKAEKFLSQALKKSELITDPKQKTEMRASLHFSLAKLKVSQKEESSLRECIEEAQNAAQEFEKINDHERALKVNSFIGRIYVKMGDITNAIEQYEIGLKKATENSRYDEMKLNALALMEYGDSSQVNKKELIAQMKRYCRNHHLQNEEKFWKKRERE